MRILVADDDRELSKLICTLLAGAGHQAFPAFDGASTMMSAMRVPQPNLIILDVRMPAGDGQLTLTKLKQAGKTASIPVLVLTAVDDPAVRAEMMGKGATAFMQKPFDSDELLAAITQLSPSARRR
jgi:DNA-binding response OmpR family regulator